MPGKDWQFELEEYIRQGVYSTTLEKSVSITFPKKNGKSHRRVYD